MTQSIRYTQRNHTFGNIKTWISNRKKQDNVINKPKKPGTPKIRLLHPTSGNRAHPKI
jgi:hypothetical protein